VTVAAPPRPYKGLMPFDDAKLDALLFFGREREREIIAANLLASRLTVLYGPSGVGKTSLLRAGVAQQLRSLPDAEVAVFSSWAEDPTEEIDAAIAAGTGVDVYLILDQVEEYFLYHGADAAFARRLPEIVREAGRVNVLLGIREDALAKLDFFKGRIPNLFSNYLRLDHLDRPAARQAILGPLQRLNELWPAAVPYSAEPELVEAVLDQVATGRIEYGLSGRGIARGRDEPPRIEAPFLQLVLERLWDVEEDVGSTVLRLGTLERLGGAETIVREHLEHALASLDPRQQELAAEIFDHLVTPSGTKIAHGVGDLAGYASASREELGDVLARLSNERIVRRVDDAAVDGRFEIFHDVLAGGVLAWRAAFDAERELERERRRRRRAVAVASLALVALAAVAAIALFALSQRDRAQDRARSARAREFAARALSELTRDPQQSLRLAVAAADNERTLQVEDVLRSALATSRLRKIIRAHPSARTVEFDESGRLHVPVGQGLRVYRRSGATWKSLSLASGGTILDLDTIRSLSVSSEGLNAVVRDTRTGRLLRSFRQPGRIHAARFDDFAELLAVVAENQAGRVYARIFRVRDGDLLRTIRHRGTRSVAFDTYSQFVATGSADGTARLWHLRTGRLVRTFVDPGATEHVLAVEFDPIGELLATASGDSVVRVWDVASGVRRQAFLGHTDAAVALAWSPDGTYLADASEDGRGQILDVRGIGPGRVAGVLARHQGPIRAISYSFDGKAIATVGADGTARMWDARVEREGTRAASQWPGKMSAAVDQNGRHVVMAGVEGATLVALTPGRERRTVLADRATVAGFNANGTRIVVGTGRQATLHDIQGRRLATFRHRGAVTDAAFTPRGNVVTSSSDGWVRVFDVRGSVIAHLDHGSPVARLAISTNGLIATGGIDGTVRLWRQGEAALVATGHEGAVTVLRFAPDGATLASGGLDGKTLLWDARTAALRRTLAPVNAAITDIAFRPGGMHVATTTDERGVRLSDVRTGATLRQYIGHFAAVNSAAFSADGRWLVTTSAIAAAIWNVRFESVAAYLRGHTAPSVRIAVFTPDGKSVITAGDDGTVRIYACEFCGGIDDLVTIARARLAGLRPVR
jgi:WD40 repeat protein